MLRLEFEIRNLSQSLYHVIKIAMEHFLSMNYTRSKLRGIQSVEQTKLLSVKL